MARIRSIKPEFWSSPGLPADPWERLLYIAMWNWADDNGIGTANPRELLGFAFPNDENLTLVDIRRMLGGIRRVFGVVFYEVAGRPYYSIPSWEKHQKIDRRSAGRHPLPEVAEAWLYDAKPLVSATIDGPSTESHESTPSIRRDSGAGTGEQGNRGTGERTSSVSATSAPTPKPAPPSKAANRRGTRLPDGWQPSTETIATIRHECPGVDLDAEHRKFGDYWRAKTGAAATKADWDATWRNWIRTAAERGQSRASPTRRRNDDIDWNAALNRAADRDAQRTLT